MDRKIYFEENANLKRQLRFLRFIIFLMAIAVIIQGYFVYSSGIHQKIILIPPYVEGEAYITGRDASDSYLRAISAQVTFLRLNYNPANVEKQMTSFLQMVDNAYYKDVKPEVLKLIDNVKELKISSVFFPENFEVDRSKKVLYITGKLFQWTENKEFITGELRVYALKYKIEGGRFWVVKFIFCGDRRDSCQL